MVGHKKEEPFSEAVAAIKTAEIFGGTRDRLIKALLGKSVSFNLTIERTDRTFAMFSDTAYRNGRTVIGTISEDGVKVRVWFPEVLNEVVDDLEPGASHSVTGIVAGLDRLSLRPTIRADAPPADALPAGAPPTVATG